MCLQIDGFAGFRRHDSFTAATPLGPNAFLAFLVGVLKVIRETLGLL